MKSLPAPGAARLLRLVFAFIVSSTLLGASPLKIAYSDWPAWVAWDIAVQRGWLKSAGVEVEFVWSDYAASLETFSTGKVDAVFATNGDALGLGAKGVKCVVVMLTDYSNGNDMIVARPDIAGVANLKGRKIGLELGLVPHLLVLNALAKAGLTEADVTLVNVPTSETPAALAAGRVDAIAAWQPSSGEALKALSGARAIYSSADEPGLIYDVLAVTPASLAARRDEWRRLVTLWDRIVGYINNPLTRDEAIRIMAARTQCTPEEYAAILKGTRLLSLAEGARIIGNQGGGFGSLHGSMTVSNDFNVKTGVYVQAQEIRDYIDSKLTAESLVKNF